jgi:hypothetical protein
MSFINQFTSDNINNIYSFIIFLKDNKIIKMLKLIISIKSSQMILLWFIFVKLHIF